MRPRHGPISEIFGEAGNTRRDEATARGLHFQLGIWTQGYTWVDSPDATYVIDGLSANNHAGYCRDALRTVLEACPNIAGLTLRVHGESGVPEGSYDFWRTVFQGVIDTGRQAGFGRDGSFCGYLGWRFASRCPSRDDSVQALPVDATHTADSTLRPAGGDWQKYLYTYRLFGRLLFNPDADRDSWRRYLVHEFGQGAGAVEQALAHASRVLPLVTSAHHVSADNITSWPEMYTNMPIVDELRPHPYRDKPAPKRFGTVSPLDPALFTSIEEFADEVVRGERSAWYSPLRVAEWLDELGQIARDQLTEADRLVSNRAAAEFQRLAADVGIQAQIGRFFAAKLRAGVAFAPVQAHRRRYPPPRCATALSRRTLRLGRGGRVRARLPRRHYRRCAAMAARPLG